MASPAPTPNGRQSRPWLWAGALVVTAISAGAVAAILGPLRDPDLYWHIRLGNELLDGISIYDAGRDWSFAPVQYTWVSTQWIVEILFAWLNDLAGFSGLIAYRTVTTILTLLTLGLVIFRNTRVWAAVVVFPLPAATLFIFAQERPQQVSFIMLPLVGYWWLQATRDAKAPRWWLLLIISAVWANCHGLWVLLPIVLGLALVGRLMDHGRKDPALKPLVLGVFASVVGGCITPVGPLNLLAPIRFAGTTAHIKEWDPTNFIFPASYGLSAMLLLLVIAWARGRVRPARSEILLVAVMAIMAAAASRNLCPAVLVLAPVLAWRLSVAFAGPRSRPLPEGLAPVVKPATFVVGLVGLVLAAGAVALSVPLPVGTQPVSLVKQIAASEGENRVLNSYNAGGLVLWFARPEVSKSFVQVGIDGRADRYGAAYIDDYLAMQRGKPGWEATVARLNPNVALLANEDALVPLLQSRGWQVIGREAEYVLMTPNGVQR
ncbi:MAG TPA: hypothetical protein DCQ04_12505 [Actinobacteria bacterium]|nr:hypothetical protein [Actinomycetota bacterium]